MRKNELKVGETYAVHLSPNTARRKWGINKPLKATLVAVDGTIEETLTVVGWNHYGKLTSFEDGPQEWTVAERGIVVDLVDDDARRGDLSPSGRYVSLRGMRLYGRVDRASFDAAEEYEFVSTDEEERYKAMPYRTSRIALESGACFVSTWAEYEASQEAEKAWEERRRREAAEALAAAQAGAEEAAGVVSRVLDHLLAAGFVIEEEASYSIGRAEDYLPEAYLARKDDVRVRIELQYYNNNWRVERKQADGHPLTGCVIEKLTGEALLALVATPFDS